MHKNVKSLDSSQIGDSGKSVEISKSLDNLNDIQILLKFLFTVNDDSSKFAIS